MQIYQHTGQDAEAHALAWTIFYRCRGVVGLDNLLKVIGESWRSEIVTQEVERIQASQEFSIVGADFMDQTGHVDECARYIERNADQINGQNYYWLPRLADTLQSDGHLLAATSVFRALLVSLLERDRTKAYRHGVGYCVNWK